MPDAVYNILLTIGLVLLLFIAFHWTFGIQLWYFLRYLSFFPRYYTTRLYLKRKLQKTAQQYNLPFYEHRKHACLGKIEDEDCEFSVVTPKARYALKLIGLKNRNLTLLLTNRNFYYTKRPSLSRRSNIDQYPYQEHKLPTHRFFVPDDKPGRTITPVWLINPCPRLLFYQKNHSNTKTQPYDFDVVDGITIHTLTGFLRRIQEDCTNNETA